MRFHVILFNGPPSVGKDTLALYAQSIDSRSRHVKFVSTLRIAVAALLNYPLELMETAKDDPEQSKFGRTIRQNLIEVGETLKGIYGGDFFGEVLADRLLTMPMQTPYVVVSDLGFPEELASVVNALKPERVTVVRLHQEGRTFDGDSRNYIQDGQSCGARIIDIDNPKGDREYAKVLIRGLVEKVLNA